KGIYQIFLFGQVHLNNIPILIVEEDGGIVFISNLANNCLAHAFRMILILIVIRTIIFNQQFIMLWKFLEDDIHLRAIRMLSTINDRFTNNRQDIFLLIVFKFSFSMQIKINHQRCEVLAHIVKTEFKV